MAGRGIRGHTPFLPESDMPHEPIYPENAVLLAPLADYTDYPYRRACRAHGCRYAFTPLVDAGCLARAPERARHELFRGADEPWLGVQVLGARPDFLEEAVRVVNDLDYQVLDFNLGCPMPKVTKRGAGAALGLNPSLALECLDVLVGRSRFPVTAKIRVLDAADPEPTLRLALALQEHGIQALTIHGRVMKAIYAGPVAVEVIRAVRDTLRIPVIANGGIFSRKDMDALRAATGCSRVMAARGSIGNPWLFRELTAPGPSAFPPPTQEDVCAEMAHEVEGMLELYGENLALRCSRKIILAYMRGRGFRHDLKNHVSQLHTRADFLRFMEELRRSIAAPPQAVAAGESPCNF